MKLRSSIIGITSALLMSSLVGCAGHIDDGITAAGTGGMGGTGSAACVPNGGTTTPPATFATVQEAFRGGGAIMQCASAPCHGAGGQAPPVNPLTLQDDANLYNNVMSYTSAACGNMKLVNPGHPDQSALIQILNGPCGVTPRMPFGCSDDSCLPPDYIAAISQWIANCAPAQ